MSATFTLAELAARVGGALEGDGQAVVRGVATLDDAGPGQVSFYGNTRYKQALLATRATAVFLASDAPRPPGVACIVVGAPHLAYARAAQLFHPPLAHAPGIDARASVDASAQVDATATLYPFSSVGAGAQVGPRAVLYPGAYVGPGARVGADTVLKANAVVEAGCVVGARCLLHAGAVIGADGFGFAFDLEHGEHVKIPQVGIARVEDDVEVGAGTCVDRATTGETVVGRGSKLDNLVQVGHNSQVGPLSILCAQVGLSGSSDLGTGVVLAGQVGVAGHLRIGDGAKVGAQAGVMSPVDDGAVVVGSPAMPHRDFMRSAALFARLPELAKKERDLERAVEALAARLEALERTHE